MGGLVGAEVEVTTEATLRQVAELGTIVGVWAHPDDETYLSGGLMAAAVAQGQRVVCVTATRGEAGSLDEERWPPSELAQVRTDELAEALERLGVTEHHWLDYPDGGLADRVAADAAIARLVLVLEDVRPSTVVTFGPQGITGHADHRTVSAWVDRAVEAVELAQRPRVLQAAETLEWWDSVRDAVDGIDIYMGFEPDRIRRADADVVLLWDEPWITRKLQAIKAQVSQTSFLLDAVGEDWLRTAFAEEVFVDG